MIPTARAARAVVPISTAGQVIGASDRNAAEPRDRPVTPGEIAATVYRGLGIDTSARLPGPDGRPLPVIEEEPIGELFRS